ncbi:hypothetical protein BU14_0293s0024 [Porphyra umbilicalis]|uniref:ubiquitinyl hydrolase 1 n=1 Tax=Porphyra umbilicalis TaxID=2786 RepID=A0A1X6P149_PORUM|nr:hypothetical protein BU14_0293s0024 [Porphyra umbilicalis]|eukprot:OSX74353.1 hypothetical protein BU14_0293s0024 [Porphyra umbilicalis]
MAPPPLDVYHERQQLSRCAVHAVNHLLGGPVYSASDFDALCEQMTASRWVNPHRSLIPYVGNYDLNVITAALAQASPPHTLRWHDARHPLSSLPLDLPPPPARAAHSSGSSCTPATRARAACGGSSGRPHTGWPSGSCGSGARGGG